MSNNGGRKNMKMVTYKVLSKAMRELTGQVAELDEAIEIRLVFGEKVKITISMDWATMDAARAAELAEHLAKAAELVNNFKYAGYSTRKSSRRSIPLQSKKASLTDWTI